MCAPVTHHTLCLCGRSARDQWPSLINPTLTLRTPALTLWTSWQVQLLTPKATTSCLEQGCDIKATRQAALLGLQSGRASTSLTARVGACQAVSAKSGRALHPCEQAPEALVFAVHTGLLAAALQPEQGEPSPRRSRPV